MGQIVIGDILTNNHTNKKYKVSAVTKSYVLFNLLDSPIDTIKRVELNTVRLMLKTGHYTIISSSSDIVMHNVDNNSKCFHNWVELTLFTSSITYCSRCDAEKK